MRVNIINHGMILQGALLLLITVFGVGTAQAATGPVQPAAPKIGLALAGGSAGGFAHIGILQWLEENRIPADYVVGTSMGGLIGGCYAMGMTPGEIRAVVAGINWNEIFNPNPPYNAMEFRRKEDYRNYPLFELGLRDRQFNLPGGLNVYRVDLLLSRLTLPYSRINDFNELSIPFRCIATDIRSADPVTLATGALKDALRATMAFPGVFTPVQRDGRLLVDGGILRNVPVEAAREMGAEVVIAVNIAAPVPERPRESIDSVLSQTIDTVVAHNAKKSLSGADIVLAPPLDGLGLLSWEAVDRYIELGYHAAAEHASELRKLAVDETTWARYQSQRQSRRRWGRETPEVVEVIGASPLNESRIKKRLNSFIAVPVDPKRLEKNLTEIMGTGLFESLSYQYATNADHQTVLRIVAKEKQYGPPFIHFGMEASSKGLAADTGQLTVGSRLVAYNPAGPQSEFRLDFGFGSEFKLSGELYKPIAGSRWFVAPAAWLDQENGSLFESGDRLNNYKIDQSGVGFDLGYSLNRFSEARLGYRAGHQDARVTVGQPFGADYDGSLQMARFQWAYSSADDPLLPRKGLDWKLNAGWYFAAPGATEEFGAVENRIRWSIPVGSDHSVFVLAAGGASVHHDSPLPQQFSLGGPFRLGAFQVGELHGENYLLGGLGYLRSVGQLPTGRKIHAGIWFESGGVGREWPDLELTSALSVGVFSSTLFGPVYGSLSFNQDSDVEMFIGLGHIF
jgi:NTE family protein